jgi:hypothetical protein
MSAPTTAKLGSRVTIRATGLTPGRYTLELAIEALRGGASPTNCVGKVGSARSVGGRVKISGALPTRLSCYQGVGPVEGYQIAKPGRYHLTLGISFAPNGFSNTASFITHEIRLVRSGSRIAAPRVLHCGTVGGRGFGQAGVGNITAEGVSCAVARRVFRHFNGVKAPKGWRIVHGPDGGSILVRGHARITGDLFG